MEVYYNSNSVVRNCNVPCCKGQHYIEFKNGKAVIPAWELFQIEKSWKKNVKIICGIECEKEYLCNVHKKLNTFTFFSEYIRDRNINRNDVVSKILIRENYRRPYCLNYWCFEIYDTEWAPSEDFIL